ncbi:hypothetical protein Zmor_009385 [Zophobas morio]|uniref:Nose resistant-to-fluoxetine protein N-terminal domain-containing protein n=1 Tax=Zophobas morio TaxID=2755281 RepID=A0AA38IP85_9CUCU|nr:hypothetical protein Zmor_009385 [Zophobas morio]
MRSIIVLVYTLFLFSRVACITEDVYNYFIHEVIASEKIREKIRSSLPDTEEGRSVALTMYDASTKIPNGLVGGNYFDLGHFDECYGIQYGDIYGKYCLGAFPFNQMPVSLRDPSVNTTIDRSPRILEDFGDPYTGYHFAVCVPSNWSVTDIPGSLIYGEEFCYSKATEKELSTGAIVTIVVLGIFLVLVVASTAFDLFLYYTKRESPHELFIAFSFFSNGKKLLRSTKNPDQLLCLNGIKSISMMWIVIGHSYSGMRNSPLSNFAELRKWMQNAANMYMMGATIAVDSFFVAAGLVAVYTFLKSRDKGVKFNIILYYIHRYLRLTPVLIILVLVHLFLLDYFGNGPLWRVVDITLVQVCEEAWWSTILYITNFVQSGSCIPQTWYLTVDMQLFILSPIVLIPLAKWPKVGLGILGVLVALGSFIPFILRFTYGTEDTGLTSTEAFRYVFYYQSYTRFGPYVIGMTLGYFIYKMKKNAVKRKLQWPIVLILWLFFLSILVACLYAGYWDVNLSSADDKWGNSLFLAFDRQGWAVGVAGVIFLCVAGYGGPIDWFLSLPIFQFFTKVSYSVYLVHQTIIFCRYAAMRSLFQFSDSAVMHAFWGDFMFTLALSIILWLTFESPVPVLEKYLFGSCSRKQKQNVKQSKA